MTGDYNVVSGRPGEVSGSGNGSKPAHLVGDNNKDGSSKPRELAAAGNGDRQAEVPKAGNGGWE